MVYDLLQLRFTYRDTNKLRLSKEIDASQAERLGRSCFSITRYALSLARLAQAERDNESGFFMRTAGVHRFIRRYHVKNLRQQLAIWRRAAASLPHCSQDEHIVRQALERKVLKLQKQLDERIRDTTKRACPKETFQSTLTELKGKYKIRDKPLLLKASLSIAFAVTLFFLHSLPELQTLSLGWTALLGAVLVLILADRETWNPYCTGSNGLSDDVLCHCLF
ncbi:P protein [Eumeta japonica]|uniref:P protein n=1 Tax=Eumeta variegata TaxID=151549 RepID=A0A4C1VXH1_EUMVA|nr:P protein [Eumeta japonica]